jgi:TonB-linked SusC/RagA family outer membrane protein
MKKFLKKLSLIVVLLNYSMVVVLAQQFTVKGSVKDTSGNPLPGATVLVKGHSTGTITDYNGNFVLSVDSASELIVSYIGFVTKEIKVEPGKFILITLIEDAKNLDELIVVGYGLQKETKLTGAVSVVKMNNVDGRPITNMSQALSGTVSGLQVTQNSGQPGQDGADIRIRGIGTLTAAGQGPLILVDGVSSRLQGLDPNDIESISVLKDAASAAIYGSRAANGVILVTTKKGKKGTPIINYHAYYGLQSPTRLMELITDMPTHMELLNEAKRNIMGDGSIQFPIDEIEAYKKNSSDVEKYPNTDWFNYFYEQPTPIQNHHISVSGGGDNTLFNFSLGYLEQDGVRGLSNLNRYNFRLNTEVKISDKIKIGTILSGLWSNLDGTLQIAGIINDWGSSPGVVIQSSDGRYGGPQVTGDGNVGNPLAHIKANERYQKDQTYEPKAYVEIDFTPNLKFQSNVALRHSNTSIETLRVPYQLWNFRDNSVSFNSPFKTITKFNQNVQSFDLTYYTTLNYHNTIGKHYFNTLLGHSVEKGNSNNFSASISDVFSKETPVLDAGISEPSVAGSKNDWALISYFGRINYDYNEKYLFEANIRIDGSSKFNKTNRWGIFPSFSGGWRISKEDFFPKNTFVSDLKLRSSWGMLGNQNIGSNYPKLSISIIR